MDVVSSAGGSKGGDMFSIREDGALPVPLGVNDRASDEFAEQK